MYRLYWDRGSANMAPHAVLREAGAAFELVRVDVAKGENRSPAYLALNPNGRVPTLEHGGQVFYEAAAIVLYICENHPEAGLMPLPGTAQRPVFLQWLFFLTNTLQEDLQHWWHAENYVAAEASAQDLKTVSEQRIGRILSDIDSTLAKAGPHLAGDRFSAVDIYFTMLCRWTRRMDKTALAYPHVKALVDRVAARPAWAAMMQAEGIDWTGFLA